MMRLSIFKTIKTIGAAVGLVTILSLSSLSAVAQDKGSMTVAFGDVPGGEMVNFMIAVARAAERGVKVEVHLICSLKILLPRRLSAGRPISALVRLMR